MRTVILSESSFANAEQLHAFLAEKLDFPDYYGCNLDALNDCLGDICEPTTIVIDADHEHSDADEEGGPTFFEKACRVIRRAAESNDDLKVMDAHEYEEHLFWSDSPEDFE